ncbi:S24 family peptidase [Rhabdochromatium marinum]|uniref:S24 family peptidase n=1 Tax=Rhabdochromatium marinum TaxID=48729 RepID=UPI0019056CD7|nr:S24 family peptidase [Rhabdochromatium marinum]MBK1649374.1 peptidase [Rhabdochromatium marinum]
MNQNSSTTTLNQEAGLDHSDCALQEPFALQVLGPDMEPEFPDRCVVIIEPRSSARDGMYIFAEAEGVRWLRQYRQDEQGRSWLIALHPDYPQIALDGLEWQVLGVVIQRNIRRKIKHYDYDAATDTHQHAPVAA